MTEVPWLIKRSEVARLFKVSTKTLRRWEKAGLLTPSPESLVNQVYYVRADVERLFNEQGTER